MTSSKVHVFDKTLQKTEAWLADLAEELGWEDQRKVYRALRVILHTLRDRLPLNEGAQFGAQLPMLIRGLYYESWSPSRTPDKWLKKEQFVEIIEMAFRDDPDVRAERVLRAVFRTIEKHISAGESRDVAAVLPEKLRRIWSEAGDL